MKHEGYVRTLFKAVGFSVKAAPWQSALLGVFLLGQGLAPAAGALLTKITVDLLVQQSPTGGNAMNGILVTGTYWLVYFFLRTALDLLVPTVQAELNERVTRQINLSLIDRADSETHIERFDDPGFHNEIDLLRSQSRQRPTNLMMNLAQNARFAISITSLLVLVASFRAWFPIVLLAGLVPQVIVSIRLQKLSWNAHLGKTLDLREAQYYVTTSLDRRAIPETKIYGFLRLFHNLYGQTFDRVTKTMRGVRKTHLARALPVAFFGVSSSAAVIISLLFASSSETTTPGDIALVLQSIAQIELILFDFIQNISYTFGILLFFKSYFNFTDTAPKEHPHETHDISVQQLFQTITFDNVSFTYPDGTHALKDVSFEIRRGERVALIGENGAGKSTVVKLLCGLYGNFEGSILVDGRDIRTMSVEQWRNSIGVVFQNPEQFSLPVWKNVFVDDAINSPLSSQHDGTVKQKGLEERFPNLSSHIGALPDGWRTRLGKSFGGAELSGGQWQRVSILRALARDAQLLVMDEPEKSLDAKSENTLHRMFEQIADGRTAVYVSHRLGSIRFVDKLLVFRRGELVEVGTHEELVAQDGEYSSLFNIQATKYSTPPIT